MSKDYDRVLVGRRIRQLRELLGISMDHMAEKIERAPRYYADIERGKCGMSIQTMLGISFVLHVSLDDLILGPKQKEPRSQQEEVLSMLARCPKEKQEYALELLKLFIKSCG